MSDTVLSSSHRQVQLLESSDQFTSVFGTGRGRSMGKDDLTIKEAAEQFYMSADSLWAKVPKAFMDGWGDILLQEYLQVQQSLNHLDLTLIRERGHGIDSDDFMVSLPNCFSDTPPDAGLKQQLHEVSRHNRVTLFGVRVGNLLVRHEWSDELMSTKAPTYMWQCWFNNLTEAGAPGLRKEDPYADDHTDNRVVLSLAKHTTIDPYDKEKSLAWLYGEDALKQALPLAGEVMAKRFRLFMECDIEKYFKRW